jgi:UDP-2,3-diacylglucosamine pyrophosphatase LpxH
LNSDETCLVLADAHLRGAEDEAQGLMVDFLDRWRRMGPALVLLGDFFEYLAGENRPAIEAYGPVLDALGEFERLEIVEGNHDFDLSTHMRGLGRARIHPRSTVRTLAGLRCRLLHGDRASASDWGTRALRAVLQSKGLRFARDRLLPQGALFRFALAFASFSRRHNWPGRQDESNATRMLAATELARSKADAALFAHTHKPLLERTPDGILANPGEARHGGGYLFLSAGWIRLHRFPDGALIEEIDVRRLSRKPG